MSLLPGATLGVLGGGQLGRMLGLALNLVIFKKKIRSLGSFSERSPR